ncbi:MAG: sigma-70 family RNA polymerase sigma factor [Saprospiraceae bacterium]|nr:sigma-70 family RNA polymerase sigma factor [Candidatus Vicinibacter affinis]MBP6173580.1 sigma-70 family RNA polymerase sigma factor [Saprospiraceae bacterium]MBK6573920.1 sigma-70 family RNA polymerase sigma factor [Candidatus Vicinibacter affinis]MBK6821633.1 sigma-70 family RNA polymerase sigma factor [Candidatus Vicinibacter affinis]MBK7302860.1 sigma-70 family RNA polymerase sigma factor [Candidatus Vicinibacter affinis]
MKSDVQEWEKLRAGDQAALKYIYETYFSPLTNYGLRISPHLELIEDCIQDLFVELWRLHATLGQTDSVKNYLMGSLRRKIVRRLQEKNKFDTSELQLELKASDEPNFLISLIEDEEDSQQKLKLAKAMSQLSNRQREAIYLKYAEGMDYDQICEQMELQYQSVRNLVSTGINRLKEIIVLIVIFFIKFEYKI